MKFTFHTDEGHGWMEVSLSMVKDLGLQTEISSFSYINGQTVYLEEDCDAFQFIRAFKLKHGYQPEFEEKFTPVSFVRNFARFKHAV
tara:strand:- start:162 stop:422 length:261 start_codon:yes stop_codon:yes gene_type:complete